MFFKKIRKAFRKKRPALNLKINAIEKETVAITPFDSLTTGGGKRANIIKRITRGFRRAFTYHLPRVAAVAMMMFGMAMDMYADVAAGNGKLKDAASQIEQYQTGVSALMKAIAAAIAVVGAFSVYFKMQNGDQDVKKTIMLVVGGCIAFLVMSEALPKMLA